MKVMKMIVAMRIRNPKRKKNIEKRSKVIKMIVLVVMKRKSHIIKKIIKKKVKRIK